MSLAQLGRFHRSYNVRQDIVKQGDEATEFFILIDGVIGIYIDGVKVADVKTPGAYVGEMAAILNKPRNATMRCESNVNCYALPIDAFSKLLEANPDVAAKLIHSLAERLDKMTQAVEQLKAAKPTNQQTAA